MPAATLDCLPGNQGKRRRVANRCHRHIGVQLRPIQMVRSRPLHIHQLLNGRTPEPGKMLERNQQLFRTQQQPKAVLGDVGNFNRRSECSRHFQFPSNGLAPQAAHRAIGELRGLWTSPAQLLAKAKTLLHRLGVKHGRAYVFLHAKRKIVGTAHHVQRLVTFVQCTRTKAALVNAYSNLSHSPHS